MTQKATTFETVRNEFLRWIRINQVPPKPPLCRAFPMIPSKGGDPGPCYLLTDYVIGDAADRLCRQMKARAWHPDNQQRKIFALVQSFGSGKTKTVIELSKQFLVVPIRTLMELDNFKKFKGRIDKNFTGLLKSIENMLSPSEQYRQIKQFHENSVDLLLKLIYGYVDITLDLYENFGNSSRSFVEDHRVRRLLATFIMLSSDVGHLVWSHLEEIDITQVIQRISNTEYRIVVAFDEIHDLISHCQGYFLHSVDVESQINANYSEFILEWRDEQKGKPSRRRYTDLFHLLRCTMVEILGFSAVPFAMAMLSTNFRTLDAFDFAPSPLQRDGMIEQFCSLATCTAIDVVNLLHHYFEIHGELDSSESYIKNWEGRPLYVFEKLVRKLWEEAQSAKTLTVPRVREISAIAYSNAKSDCVEKIQSKYIFNSAVDNWTSRRIIRLLRYAQVLCDNRLQLHEDAIIKEVVSEGFAQLEADSSNSFRIVDPLFLDALESCCRTNDLLVYEVLKYLVHTNHFALTPETSSKGTVFEKLVARFLIKGRSFLQTYGVHINATRARRLGNISLEDERKRLLDGDHYYFPTTRIGPDGWTTVSFEDVSDGTSWIGIQCMCYKQKLSFPEFKKALSSLTLTRVFGDKFVATVREKSKRYVRMVFSICGFDEHTWFMVTEYNLAYPKQPIILCSAYEISQHDEAALSLLEKLLRQMNAKHPVSPDVKEWRLNGDMCIGDQKTFLHRMTKKEKLKRSDLEEMCRLRQISCSKMTKEKLALALFSHLKQWNNNKSTYFDGLIIYPPIPQKRRFDDK